MSSCCSGSCSSQSPPPDNRYRKVLWVALLINFLMFGVELVSSLKSGSVSLLADSADFLADAGNYAVSLFVLGMATIWRSRAAYVKGIVMGAFGVLVLARALWIGLGSHVPEAETMGVIGILALAANGVVAFLLYAFRNGDANMRSVWLCTRNDQRWRIEEAFKRLKHRLNLEHVSGLSQQAAMHDFAAKIVCDNLQSLASESALRAASLAPTRRINRAAAHSILKPLLPALLLGTNIGARLLQALQLIASRTYSHRPGIVKSRPRLMRPKPHKSMTQKPC